MRHFVENLRGSLNDFTEVPFDDEQILRQHNTAHVTPPPLAYTPTPPVLATMEPLDTFLMGDEVISTIPERENDEFIKSSVDDLVLIPRESELTLDSTDLECSMPIDTFNFGWEDEGDGDPFFWFSSLPFTPSAVILTLGGEPKGSNDFTEVPFDDEQILRQHNTAHVTPPPLAYTPTPPVLATMEPLDTLLMGDEVISTILERENDEFIKSSVDDLVLIPRESELTLDSTDLECSMPIDPPLPCTDVLGATIVDIDLLLGEHLDTLSTGDREINFNPIRDIKELEHLLVDDPVPVLRVFDAPLGHSDSISRSFDVTFSNSLFDFNDDYNLCYDNPLFNKEFEDISSLDPLESTPVIDESTLIVTPLSASKPFSLREVERFDPFFP
ncbi:hypothetical protein Tco_0937422 [Tanacetum coccineum]|uniref:NAC domain-containing protein n=1 Tax=Tanacetum coccineum TaxID=301880 RepID=A0ABQ5DF08_9ASTR